MLWLQGTWSQREGGWFTASVRVCRAGNGNCICWTRGSCYFRCCKTSICMPNLQDRFIILHTDEPFSRSQAVSSDTICPRGWSILAWVMRAFLHLYCPVSLNLPRAVSSWNSSCDLLSSLLLHWRRLSPERGPQKQTLFPYESVTSSGCWAIRSNLKVQP